MKVTIMNQNPISITSEVAKKLERSLQNKDAEYVKINGNTYKKSHIISITETLIRKYKTPQELGMPNLGDGLTDKQRARLSAPSTNTSKSIIT